MEAHQRTGEDVIQHDTAEAQRIVIVGASLGGLRTAEQLRAAGWAGDIQVIGEEHHPPYNRPPLSKEVLTTSDASAEETLDRVFFRRRRSTADVNFLSGASVIASNLSTKTLHLAEGTSLTYDGLVIATGLRAKRLTVPGPLLGRHVLRTLEDSLSLRRDLTPGARIVIIGAGFIGCEVAAAAALRGCQVTLVEGGRGPMHRPLGTEIAEAFRHRLEARGIQCITDQRVEEFTRHSVNPDRVDGARLTGGDHLHADAVVEAVGSVPNTEWLQDNELDLQDGVLTDQWLRVNGARHTVAVGDIARFPDSRFNQLPRRVEHWANAAETAKTAARSLIAALTGGDLPAPCDALPSFWSDQFGLRITGIGSPALADQIRVLEGDLQNIDDGVVIGYLQKGRLIGVVLAGVSPKKILAFRQELTPVTI